MFAALGAKVTVVEKRVRLLEFCDAQITEGLQYHLRDVGVVFRLSEEVIAVAPRRKGERDRRANRGSCPNSRGLRRFGDGRRQCKQLVSSICAEPTAAPVLSGCFHQLRECLEKNGVTLPSPARADLLRALRVKRTL